MPKHDPPGDDAALLELERELMELDRAIRAADENREAINYALFDRRDELMARIFTTPAAGLAGLAVQACAILAAGPSRVTIRREATADIGAPRSLMKTYRPSFCSRWRRRRPGGTVFARQLRGGRSRLLSERIMGFSQPNPSDRRFPMAEISPRRRMIEDMTVRNLSSAIA
jgi:hypothetical protein